MIEAPFGVILEGFESFCKVVCDVFPFFTCYDESIGFFGFIEHFEAFESTADLVDDGPLPFWGVIEGGHGLINF